MSNIVTSSATKLASSFGLSGDPTELINTLKATAFKGQVSDAQMTALIIVAQQYGLNPFTKEIYAFPDKQNGIVPVVGVDGWSRIINTHPQFDGMEFRQSENMVRPKDCELDAPEWMECVIFRKDRSHPIVIREYLDEVYRAPFKKSDGYLVKGPWQSHTKRFMRHKTMIQCARLAFGFVGIYDQDEAERIVEKDMGSVEPVATKTEPQQLPPYQQADFEKNLPAWKSAVEAGKATPEQLIARSSSKYTLSPEQVAAIHNLAKPANVDGDGVVIDADFVKSFEAAE